MELYTSYFSLLKKVAAVEETKPLAEANRAPPVTLGFGNDEEDF